MMILRLGSKLDKRVHLKVLLKAQWQAPLTKGEEGIVSVLNQCGELTKTPMQINHPNQTVQFWVGKHSVPHWWTLFSSLEKCQPIDWSLWPTIFFCFMNAKWLIGKLSCNSIEVSLVNDKAVASTHSCQCIPNDPPSCEEEPNHNSCSVACYRIGP